MAEREYTVVAPDGKEVTLIGPVGASQDEVIAQAQKLYNPSSQNQGTPIYGDLPSAVGGKPNIVGYKQQPVKPPKNLIDYAVAPLEVPLTIASGAVAPFAGTVAGMYENMVKGTENPVNTSELAQRFTYQPKSSVSQDVLEGLGKALDVAKIPAYVPTIGTTARAANQATRISPLPSYAVAQAEKVAPVVSNATDKMANILKREPKPYTPTTQALETQSSALFKKAKESGVELNVQDFSNEMNNITSNLREFGYDARLHPKVAIAVENLTNPDLPKDFKELKTLRTFIQNAQKSSDPTEKMLGSRLKADFDSYVATMPESSIVGGSKEGLAAWKEARDTYSKLSKSEIFDDMLNKADLNATKYSQSGVENYLANKLRNLANNDKQMRLFTPAEQQAINDAAKGGNVQNFLRMAGKYSPSSVIATAGGSYLGASLLGPAGAVIAPVLGAGAKFTATQMRKSDVNKLAEMMRRGQDAKPEVNWQKPITMDDRAAELLRRFNQGDQ
jgi:hypothetical protein